MSITCSCLLLFLLCLPLHACDDRRLSSVGNSPQVQKSLFSIKDHEGKRGVDEITVSKVKSSSSSSSPEKEDANTAVRTENAEEKGQNLNHRKASRDISKLGSGASTHVETKSLVSVSWRVPHKKRRERQPGFNLDYSPPKTHPPSHN